MKLSRAVIKKYGITKKAWNIQRSQSSRGLTIKTKKRNNGVGTMARKSYRRPSSRSSGMSGMMKPLVRTNGMIQDAATGLGAATALNKFAPQIQIPYKSTIAGYVFGGIAGAAACYLVYDSKNGSSTSSSIELN